MHRPFGVPPGFPGGAFPRDPFASASVARYALMTAPKGKEGADVRALAAAYLGLSVAEALIPGIARALVEAPHTPA